MACRDAAPGREQFRISGSATPSPGAGHHGRTRVQLDLQPDEGPCGVGGGGGRSGHAELMLTGKGYPEIRRHCRPSPIRR